MRPWLLIALLPSAFAQPGGALGTPASIARGDKLFAQGCSVGYCHGAGGSAARSPRLRGRSFERDYLIRVIRNGIPNTAMPAWGDRLTDADINDLSDYIQSLANAPVNVAASPATEAAATPATEKPVDTPDEHRRGRDLFFDLTRESRCSVCHRLNGYGSIVGPDITKVSGLKVTDGPQVLRYGRPRSVRTFVLKDGDRFAAVSVERTASFTRAYDLSATPPVLRNLLNTDVQSIQRQSNWRHGNAVRGYSLEDLQSIWNYVRYAAAKK
ncbi:MAG: c-type cytochrome [Acidobacteria bacterium]|nr:c-type cytochrome [Acidobacteriota bacterium]